MTRRGVLVTDGTQRSALAVVRSLGLAGHTVFVCAPRVPSLAGSSQYSFAEAAVANALDAPEQFVSDVSHLIERWRIDTLIPITEASLLALLPERESLGVLIPWPDAGTFRAISDKKALLATAASLGIAVPRQLVLSSQAEARALDRRAPRLSARDQALALRGRARWAARVARRAPRRQRRRASRRAVGAGRGRVSASVQQRIVGPGIGIFLLIWDGRLLATFAHRRLREKPPSGGVSVYSESVSADAELVERSRMLLEHMHWCGVAMVEFKRDASTGTAYLMEVNGRFWGSLQLAIDAGVDFPALLVAAASGEARGRDARSIAWARACAGGGGTWIICSLRWRKDAAALALPAGRAVALARDARFSHRSGIRTTATKSFA